LRKNLRDAHPASRNPRQEREGPESLCPAEAESWEFLGELLAQSWIAEQRGLTFEEALEVLDELP
jgi:hypothetical protein